MSILDIIKAFFLNSRKLIGSSWTLHMNSLNSLAFLS